jgi:branched-chain amino acid transport system substrate-binding protein
MRRILAMTVSLVALLNAAAAETVKIGVIGPFSGPFASGGKNFKAGIDA